MEEIYKRYTPQRGLRSRLDQTLTTQTCGVSISGAGLATISPGCIRFGVCSPGSAPAGCKICQNNSSCALVSPQTAVPITSSYNNIKTQRDGSTPPAATNSVQEWATGGSLGIYNGSSDYYMGMNPFDDANVQESGNGTVNYKSLSLSFAKISSNSTDESIVLDTTSDGKQINSGDWVVIYTPDLSTFGEDDSDGPWFLSIDSGSDFVYYDASKASYDDSTSTFTGKNAYYVAFQIFSANNPGGSGGMYQGDPFFLWSWGGIGKSSPSDTLNGAGFAPGNPPDTEGIVGYTGSQQSTSTKYGENGSDLTPWIVMFKRQKIDWIPESGDPMGLNIGTMTSGASDYTQWGCQSRWVGVGDDKQTVAVDFLYKDSTTHYSTNPPPYTFMYFVATSVGGCIGYTSNGGQPPTTLYGCTTTGCAQVDGSFTGSTYPSDPNCGSGCYACQSGDCSLVPTTSPFSGTTYPDSSCGGVGCTTYQCSNGSCEEAPAGTTGTYNTSDCDNSCDVVYGCGSGDTCQQVDPTTFSGTQYPNDSTCGGTCNGGGGGGIGNENIILYAGIGVGVILLILVMLIFVRRR